MARRIIDRGFWCDAHGDFRAFTAAGEIPRCPCGCSARFVQPRDDAKAHTQASPPPPDRPSLHRDRDRVASESLPPEQVRALLAEVLEHAPYGAKRQLALALGFRGKWALHSARSIANGHGWLFAGTCKRLGVALRELQDVQEPVAGRGRGAVEAAVERVTVRFRVS